MNQKVGLIIVTALAASLFLLNSKTHKHQNEFQSWKINHAKTYDSEIEEKYREQVFKENLVKIEAHNSANAGWQMGLTQFSDLTQEEFVAQYLTLKVNKRYDNSRTMRPADVNGDIDWQAAGKVSAVKNQGQCGSCWAFSAVGALESAVLQAGSTGLFSEQQLVDCSRSYGNQGCNGGWMDSAFQYVRDHGIASQSDYPYVARDQACKIDGGATKLKGFIDVPGCDNLLNALSGRPISVAVDASVWSQYKGGVLSSCGTAVNHGVLLVGATDQYWRIKNSWGTGWGETGFIRINRGNTCAVCNYPSYPTL